jgi:methyl-accepting chemotaxis protein
MSELLKARIKTFLVLALVMEAVVLGMAFAYRSIMTETFSTKITDLSKQILVQASSQVQSSLRKIENVTQQILLDPRLKKEIEAIQLSSWDGVTEKKAINNVRNQLTALMYLDPNIVTIRMFPKENPEMAGQDITKLISNMPLMPITYTTQAKQGLNDMIAANGEMVWVPTIKNGLFYDPALEKLDKFPGNTLTLGRLLKNPQAPKSEMVVTIEVQANMLAEALKDVQIGQNSDLLITDAQNRIVYAADRSRIASESAYPLLAADQKVGIVAQNEQQMVLAQTLNGVPWTVQLAYTPADFTGYLQTVFVVILTGISLLVLVIAFALAWIMNRPYEDEYETGYAEA